jgi:hypothetical protein
MTGREVGRVVEEKSALSASRERERLLVEAGRLATGAGATGARVCGRAKRGAETVVSVFMAISSGAGKILLLTWGIVGGKAGELSPYCYICLLSGLDTYMRAMGAHGRQVRPTPATWRK